MYSLSYHKAIDNSPKKWLNSQPIWHDLVQKGVEMYGQQRDGFRVVVSGSGEIILQYPDGTDEATGIYPNADERRLAMEFSESTTGQSLLMRVLDRSIYCERTKLLTKRAAQSVIAKALERLRQLKCPNTVSVLALDMDHFRRWNTDVRYGHTVGDLFMEWFGDILRLRTRATDIVSRWTTGDECVVVSIATEAPVGRRGARDRDKPDHREILENGTVVANRILMAAREGSIDYKSETLRQTVTIGVATALLKPGVMPEDLFQTLFERADAKLAGGKSRNERDHVHVADLLTY